MIFFFAKYRWWSGQQSKGIYDCHKITNCVTVLRRRAYIYMQFSLCLLHCFFFLYILFPRLIQVYANVVVGYRKNYIAPAKRGFPFFFFFSSFLRLFPFFTTFFFFFPYRIICSSCSLSQHFLPHQISSLLVQYTHSMFLVFASGSVEIDLLQDRQTAFHYFDTQTHAYIFMYVSVKYSDMQLYKIMRHSNKK